MPEPIAINLFDSNFVGHACSVAGKAPRLMRYERGHVEWDGITIFTDGQMFDPIVDQVRSRFKIGWLQEGRSLRPENYERSRHVLHKFDAVLTYDQQLLRSDPAYKFCIRGGIWTPREQWGLYPKTRGVSMILSDKQDTEGHRLRHQIARRVVDIDLYGPSYTPIGHDKGLAYRDYRYAIVVEAERSLDFFSEHLLDALAYGCVVLYWGCPNISLYLDDRVVVPFEDAGHLAGLLVQGLAQRAGAREGLEENLVLLRDYEITEDWMIKDGPLWPFVEALR